MNDKYELIETDTIQIGIHTLYRIRALKDIGNVKAGELGGYIENTKNLYLRGNCWVGDDAHVYGDAYVDGNAYVYGNARVYGDACVAEDARVQYGHLTKYIINNSNVKDNLLCTFNIVPINDYIYMYKRVNHVNGEILSVYDSSFKYKLNELCVEDGSEISTESCAPGLHVSHATCVFPGTTLLAVKVHVNDIITIQQGKIRCKALIPLELYADEQ